MQLPDYVCRTVVATAKQMLAAKDERKALVLMLRGIKETFECDAVAAYLYKRSRQRLFKASGIGNFEWHEPTVLTFFFNLKPPLPAEVLMAPLRRGNRVIGVVTLYRHRRFPSGVGKLVTEALKILGGLIGIRYENKVFASAQRLLDLELEGKDPKDVCYRIMHDLRRFIDYDHGASLILREGAETGRVVARQLAWQKRKSNIIGRPIRVDWKLGEQERIHTLGSQDADNDLVRVVREDDSPAKRSCLVGYLVAYRWNTPETIGCIELGSKQQNFFLDSDRAILEQFLSVTALCAVRLRKGEAHE